MVLFRWLCGELIALVFCIIAQTKFLLGDNKLYLVAKQHLMAHGTHILVKRKRKVNNDVGWRSIGDCGYSKPFLRVGQLKNVIRVKWFKLGTLELTFINHRSTKR